MPQKDIIIPVNNKKLLLKNIQLVWHYHCNIKAQKNQQIVKILMQEEKHRGPFLELSVFL